ncbi:hypothetical protein B0H17DRAFT_1191889 [Mycena rosella]|uniref:Uncharacterized protein n=1 Tax=Mycena rosella TaxID=1033263 RepID=A0AAD7GXH4_MYCRO|nr:hypothetical protein B0H17DRAFT_1191889 [Mycena rosella]
MHARLKSPQLPIGAQLVSQPKAAQAPPHSSAECTPDAAKTATRGRRIEQLIFTKLDIENAITPEVVEREAMRHATPVPIHIKFETDMHRIHDCFVWSLTEELILLENFAKIFCTDLDLPLMFWVETMNQICTQLEEHKAIAQLKLNNNGFDTKGEEPVPESMCRSATHHLLDHIEWDLLSPLMPEDFAKMLCCKLGLPSMLTNNVGLALHCSSTVLLHTVSHDAAFTASCPSTLFCRILNIAVRTRLNALFNTTITCGLRASNAPNMPCILTTNVHEHPRLCWPTYCFHIHCKRPCTKEPHHRHPLCSPLHSWR